MAYIHYSDIKSFISTLKHGYRTKNTEMITSLLHDHPEYKGEVCFLDEFYNFHKYYLRQSLEWFNNTRVSVFLPLGTLEDEVYRYQSFTKSYQRYKEEILEEFKDAVAKTRNYYERVGDIRGKYIEEYNRIVGEYCPEIEEDVKFDPVYFQLFEASLKNMKLVWCDLVKCNQFLERFACMEERYKKAKEAREKHIGKRITNLQTTIEK